MSEVRVLLRRRRAGRGKGVAGKEILIILLARVAIWGIVVNIQEVQ